MAGGFTFGGGGATALGAPATPVATQPKVTEKTMFEDLPEEIQKVLVAHQVHMLQMEEIYEEIAQHSYQPITKIHRSIDTENQVGAF